MCSLLPTVILDTNVFVAAGFKPMSHSAQVVEQVRYGQLQMVWNEPTRAETEYIVHKIPPLSWNAIAPLFQPACCYPGALSLEPFRKQISDPNDLKFAALAAATGAVLITMDQDFLAVRDALTIPILTPSEVMMQLGAD